MSAHRHFIFVLTCLTAFGIGLGFGSQAYAQLSFEEEPINYNNAKPRDRVAKLQEQLAAGQTTLEYDEQFGYVPAFLKAMGIPWSSQALVFSKTSFQQKRISPKNPRAIYFTDDVYAGFVPGGDVVEISAVDPQLGAVFYSLSQTQSDRPTIQRHTYDCTQCHASTLTMNIPGHTVRSVYPAADGFPVLSAGTFITSHESPLRERWGGWYVTGTHGKQVHMGNLTVSSSVNPDDVDLNGTGNVTDLSDHFDVRKVLTPHSDIVALMVLEHQSAGHNLITKASFQARWALRDESVMNEMLKRPADFRSPSTLSRVKSAGEPLVRYLLFSKEAALSGELRGTSDFATDFAAKGLRDAQGRSLRDFDLQTRIFKYPCSYLIYTEAFQALPDVVKDYVHQRLWEVLSGQDTTPEFAHLSAADRQAILEILRETKKDLPKYFRAT